MIDRIYIPTLGRPNTQITYDGLPDFVKDITYLVVQPHEKDLHGDKKVIVLPKSIKGIHKTREWIYNKAKNTIWGMYDDDLVFLNRNGSDRVVMTNEDWKYMLDKTYHFLTNGTAFAGHRLSFLHPSDNEYIDIGAIHCAYYFNGHIVPELTWPISLAEDLHMVLSLLEQGYNNKVWHKYAVNNKEYSEGGCNTEGLRDIYKINEAHKQLIKLHPGIVKEDGIKKNKMGEMIRLRIAWKKAYKNTNLTGFI